VAALSALKLAMGLAHCGSMLRVLVEFPVGLLGVLLLFAGVKLAVAARDMASKAEAFVMLLCTAVSLVGSSAAPASSAAWSRTACSCSGHGRWGSG